MTMSDPMAFLDAPEVSALSTHPSHALGSRADAASAASAP